MTHSGLGAVRRALATALAAALAIGAGPAMATEFTPDAAAVWAVRTKGMAEVFTRGIQEGAATDAEKLGNKDQLVANLASACDGLQGEQMKNEYGKVPRWALGAQLEACSAMNRWAGKSFMTSRVPCKDIEKALSDLGSAKPGEDPAAVIDAVNAVVPTFNLLLTAARSKDEHLNLRCTYAR